MASVVEDEMRKYEEVVETTGEYVNKVAKKSKGTPKSGPHS